MKVWTPLWLAIGCACLGACGTGSDGVVPIGPDVYMLGGLGQFTDYSSSAVKARLYKQAAEFCRQKGETISALSSNGQDSGFGTYASAEVQFRCIKSE